jgi:AcrR family transcriptional regulator
VQAGAAGKQAHQAEAAPSVASSGRERILSVARAAFIERGYADVSMQEIASAAGLTKAAIYYHFPDKEALFTSVVAAEFERICTGVAAELALGPPLRTQLERVARFAFTSGRGDFARLAGDAHLYCSHPHQQAIRRQVATPIQLVREAFLQAREAGEITDAEIDIDVVVALYFSMLGGQIKEASIGAITNVPPDVLALQVANLVMDGIGARSADLASTP